MYLKRMIIAGSAVALGGLLISAGVGICLTVSLDLPGVERLQDYFIEEPYWVTYCGFWSAGLPLAIFGAKALGYFARERSKNMKNQEYFKVTY